MNDCGNHARHARQVYTLGADDRMHFQRTIGRKGDEAARFLEPWGVAFLRGLLVVSERVGKRVQVLTPGGVPLQVVRLEWMPWGLCASGERLLVTDYDAGKVHAMAVRPTSVAWCDS